MGYFGYFGDDTMLGGGGTPTDPSGQSSAPYGGSSPGYTDPSQILGGGGAPGSAPQLPGSSPYPSSPGAPGGTIPSGTPSGLVPYPGGTSSNLPGMAPSGGPVAALPPSPWAAAPIVKGLATSTTNGALFTSPSNRANWMQLVLRAMMGAGYFDPGNDAAAYGAISALSSAYGYFLAVTTPGLTPVAAGGTVAGPDGLPIAQAAYAAGMTQLMTNLLTEAYMAVKYWQSTPAYQTAGALPPGSGLIPTGPVTWTPTRAAAPAAPAASSSSTLLLGGLAVAGVAAYLAFA